MLFTIRILWFERRRYFAAVMAVGLSGVLVATQAGIVFGVFEAVSAPIENSNANIWVGYPDTPACDLALPIPRYWGSRLWRQPEIVAVDEYIQATTNWRTRGRPVDIVVLMGCNVRENSLGPVRHLTPEQRVLLMEPGAVILDRTDAGALGIHELGEHGEILGHSMRVVGFMDGMTGLHGPYVLCSLETARTTLGFRDDQATFLLASCREPSLAPAVVDRLRQYDNMIAYVARDFAQSSKYHWIIKTKAGIALCFAALTALGVGAFVTGQTLYSATVVLMRELAILRALGISRLRIMGFVIEQSLLIGLLGLIIGTPLTFVLMSTARQFGAKMIVPPALLVATAFLTLAMALLSGLFALRSLRFAEPASLLR